MLERETHMSNLGRSGGQIAAWILTVRHRAAGNPADNRVFASSAPRPDTLLFPSRVRQSAHLTTRQYVRLAERFPPTPWRRGNTGHEEAFGFT
jgi:hypothetical protein